MKPLTWLMVVLLVTGAWAQTGSTATSTTKATKKTSAASSQDVQQLREALAAQQQQMEQQRQQMDQLRTQLQQLLDATRQANAAAQKAQSGVDQVQTAATQAQQTAADAQKAADQASASAGAAKTAASLVQTTTQDQEKRISALSDFVARFRFNGDVRIRGESFIQSGVPDRNRARMRVRFGFDGKLNEDFVSGIYLATGSLADPTTTNETFTNNFERKTIGLDRAFITYNPVAHNWLSLTGGKFAYQWQRTSVTGDPDLNPEGFDQKLSFNVQTPVLKNVTVQGIQLLYNEIAGSAGGNAQSAQDSYTLGGQISTKLQAGFWTATPSFLSLKWNRPDSILASSAFAVGATTTGATGTTPAGPFPVPGEGQGCAKGAPSDFPPYAPCVFAPNGMTNATFVDSKGKVHFWSGFNYADFILNNQFKTGLERLPVNLLLEFEQNLDAADHPLDSKGNVIPSLGRQDKEYGVDFSLGQTKKRNDMQIGYAWLRQEQDAVIASFAESDQRTPTNLIQNRVYALWKLRSNTVGSFTWWHGRVLNSNLENNAALVQGTIKTAGQVEPYLNRYQFDLIYTF
ncbi:MAG TPA: putative porin [Terriglobales bacterium]|nr:putative porin [Terriglobales bacterium]